MHHFAVEWARDLFMFNWGSDSLIYINPGAELSFTEERRS